MGRVGGHAAPSQRDSQPELLRERPGEQAHEVRVPRQPCVDPRPRPFGDGRAARVVAALEDEHGAPGPGEQGGGDEPVVAAPDDDGVVAMCHGGPVYQNPPRAVAFAPP